MTNACFKKTKAGFSLIELLIAVSLLSILVAISLPLYSQHLVKARRFEAEVTLNKLAVMVERYQIERGSYAGVVVPDSVQRGYYWFSVEGTASDYVLIATPIGVQAGRDECGILMVSGKGEFKSTRCKPH